jgi:large conductance mechanosensitive channel
MPRLPDQEDNVVTRVRDRFKEAWDGFWDFALRDNVLEVAIGLMYIPEASNHVYSS